MWQSGVGLHIYSLLWFSKYLVFLEDMNFVLSTMHVSSLRLDQNDVATTLYNIPSFFSSR